MTIGRDEVLRIAGLAKLDLDSADDSLTESLQSILDYVAMLDELDVSNVEPTNFGTAGATCLREDEPRPGLSADEALRNAPDDSKGLFRVPGVLEP